MLAYTFYETDNRVRRYAETLVKRGDHVDVVSLSQKGQKSSDVINGVNVYRIQRRIINEQKKIVFLLKVLYFFVNSFKFLTAKHFKKSYDLIHVHSVPDFEIFAALLPKLTGAKLILDIHDIVPEFYVGKFKTGNKTLVFKLLVLLEKVSIAFSHHVIIANDLWYKSLLSRSVKKEKCTTIVNFPDPTIFNNQNSEKRMNSEKIILMYPGTLSSHQGLDIAIKAMALVEKEEPNIELQIYGCGHEEEALRCLVSELDLGDKVLFHNFLSISEIAKRMSLVNIGIIPKRADGFGDEAFSTKSLEFMALGIPIIISNTKVDRYYFDESLVLFFNSGDERDLSKKIILLSKNKELRDKLVRNSLKYIENNNWEVKKHIYLDIVDKLVSKD